MPLIAPIHSFDYDYDNDNDHECDPGVNQAKPESTLNGQSVRSSHCSGEHFLYHLAGDVGQAKVATLVAVR